MMTPRDSNDLQCERRPRRRPGENRERLLQAGMSVFGALGYHGASTNLIGSTAGVPQPHIYANFSTKKALFLACVSRAVEKLILDSKETGPTRGSSHADHRSYAQIILQAYSAALDQELSHPLRELLEQLHRQVGKEQIQELLSLAVRAMLK